MSHQLPDGGRPANGYFMSCALATVGQGLAEVAGALLAAGAKVAVEQTGGFTMCVVVTRETDDHVLAITGNDEGYYLGHYTAAGWGHITVTPEDDDDQPYHEQELDELMSVVEWALVWATITGRIPV